MFIFINCTWCDLSDGVIARNSFPKTFYKIPFSNQHWPNAGQTRHFILALPGCNVYFEKKNVCITFHWNKFRHLCKTNTYIDSYLEYIMYKWGANFVFYFFFLGIDLSYFMIFTWINPYPLLFGSESYLLSLDYK